MGILAETQGSQARTVQLLIDSHKGSGTRVQGTTRNARVHGGQRRVFGALLKHSTCYTLRQISHCIWNPSDPPVSISHSAEVTGM